MPMENTSLIQKQERLFEEKLCDTLDSRNKLYKLRDLIDWSSVERCVLPDKSRKQFGRSRKDVRVMLGLLMLQAMYNGSDSFTSEEIVENVYWQYFCGFELTPLA